MTAPFFIAIVIGLFFYLTGISLPSFAVKSIGHIAELNTPLAMFTTGIYIAQTDLIKMFKKPVLYFVSAARLVVIPLVIMVILKFVPENFASETMKMAIFIAAACPVGSNVAIYSHLYNADKGYAAETIVISTLLSIVTMPFVIFVFTRFARI